MVKNRIKWFISKLKSKVKYPEGYLNVQLLTFGTLGRGKYSIKNLEDQKKKIVNLNIFNDRDDKVA